MTLLGCALAAAVAAASCGDHKGRLSSGGSSNASAGRGGVDSEPVAGGGGASGEGGAGAGAPPTDPSPGGAGGAPSEPPAQGGAAPVPVECVYHLDVEDAVGGAGGAGGSGQGGQGGAAGQGGALLPDIGKASSRLLGEYLTDDTGRALYVFGADLAGDCLSPPVSGCVGDCLLSWPIFHAPERVVAAGVDDAAFGSFVRADGVIQTTYYGWPLYYYANDSQPGDITGHGVGVWGLAELILPNVVVRRVGADRLLADGAGRTLYAFAEDTRGTTSSAPQSACEADCLEDHPPFSPSYVGPISTLEARDFTSFVRTDGTTQVAYKGAPLYYSALDDRPGSVNGAQDEGFTIVLK